MRISLALDDTWFEDMPKDEQEKYIADHPKSRFAKTKQATGESLKKALHEQHKFFKGEDYKAKSKERRSFGEFVKAKSKGIVHALKHEVKEFKTAGHAVNKLVHGDKLHPHEKAALKTVLIHSALVIGPMAISGGLSAGLTHVLPHLAGGFVEHALVMSAGKAMIFASGEVDTDALMQKMIEQFADYIANQDIPKDKWEEMFASANSAKR